MKSKLLTVGFVLGALVLGSANAEESRMKKEEKVQQKMTSKKGKMEYLSKTFEEIDTNKDGFISKKEHKEYSEKKFVELDKNKDKNLGKEEFVVKTNKNEECPYRGESAFKKSDKNGDGQVTKKEFVNSQEKKFEEMDKNKDGKISLEEFSNFKNEKMTPKKEKVKK